MSNQISTSIIMCIIFGLFSFYYFNKFQESEKEYTKLHKRFDDIYIENKKMRYRIKDLQSYKNDVSKTMKILDNELMLINNHIQKHNVDPLQEDRQPQNQNILRPYLRMQRSEFPRTSYNDNNVSFLSPELLSSLFTNMNQENYQNTNIQQNQSIHQENIEPVQTSETVEEKSNRVEIQSNFESPIEQQNFVSEIPSNNILCESSNIINDDQIYNDITDSSLSNSKSNEKIININYDISYTSNLSNYDQFLIDKQLQQ